MKQLLWFVLILGVGLTVIIALLARFPRPSNSPPLLLQVISHNPDGSACEHDCIFGVMPGYMDDYEAIDILKQHPATRNLTAVAGTSCNFCVKGDGLTICLSVGQDGLTISNMADEPISLKQPKWDLGRCYLKDILEAYGEPDYIWWIDQGHAYVIDYETRHLMLVFSASTFNQVQHPDRLEYIAFVAPEEHGRRKDAIPWSQVPKQ